jgi:hypothetical protein
VATWTRNAPVASYPSGRLGAVEDEGDELAELRGYLDQARAYGTGFDEAWQLARRRFGTNGWVAILDGQRAAWQRAYERAPQTRGDAALVTVASSHLERTWGLPRCAFCTTSMRRADPWDRYCWPGCEVAARHYTRFANRPDRRLRHR